MRIEARFLLPAAALLLAVAPVSAFASSPSGATGDLVLWQIIRASGLAAYFLLSVSVFMGVAVNARALDNVMRRAWVYEAHQSVSLLALALTALHVVLLLGNRHVPLTVVDILLPFASSWRPVPMAIGILSLYLTGLLIGSSYLRQSIGQKAWRLIHYAGFLGWLAALLHGITAGSDTDLAWVQNFYLVTGAAVGFLIVFRVVAPSTRRLPGASSLPKGARAPAP